MVLMMTFSSTPPLLHRSTSCFAPAMRAFSKLTQLSVPGNSLYAKGQLLSKNTCLTPCSLQIQYVVLVSSLGAKPPWTLACHLSASSPGMWKQALQPEGDLIYLFFFHVGATQAEEQLCSSEWFPKLLEAILWFAWDCSCLLTGILKKKMELGRKWNFFFTPFVKPS